MKNHYKNLFNYAMDCVYRYKIRTVVIIVCIALCTTVFSSVLFLKDGIVRDEQLSLKYAPDITVQGIVNGRPGYIDVADIPYIQAILGVKNVVPRVWGYGNIGNTLLVIVGVDLNDSSANYDAIYPIETGSFLQPNKNNTVVIGKAVAELFDAKVGDFLTIISESNQVHQYEVAGIFNGESAIISADTILMKIDDAKAFFEIPDDKVSDLLVYTDEVNPDYYTTQLNFAARQIGELPNVRVVTKDLLANAGESTVGSRSGIITTVWIIMLISVVLIAFNQMVVIGHESKFEVGLLKALGFSTQDIIQVRFIEGTILGVIAGSIGVLFAVIYTVILKAPILSEYMLGWATLYPSFRIPFVINADTLFIIYVVSVVPLLFATVIPSWINATADPDIAMRGART